MSSTNQKQITWEDLPDAVAFVAGLNETIDQCSIQIDARERAHLFLLNDGLLSIIELTLPDDSEPSDVLLRAIGRVLIMHKRACMDGRRLS